MYCTDQKISLLLQELRFFRHPQVDAGELLQLVLESGVSGAQISNLCEGKVGHGREA